MVKNDNNIDEILWEDVSNSNSEFVMGHYNNSHYFLLPLFGLNDLVQFKNNYIGSYIADNARKMHIEKPLILVFSFNSYYGDDCNNVTAYFKELDSYCFSYVVGMKDRKNIVAFVLRATSNIKKDYDHIVEGRYSYVSSRTRDLYKSFPFTKDVRKLLECITLQTRWYKSTSLPYIGETMPYVSELWSYFEEEKEILRYDKKNS